MKSIKQTLKASPPRALTQTMVELLREQIIGGELLPGARLPTRRELARTCGVNLLTAHRASDRLLQEGFLDARGRLGTFVVDHPPHLCRYAIAFPFRPGVWWWSRFYEAIRVAAEMMQSRDLSRRFVPRYDIETHAEGEDFAALEADRRARRVAGVIFASHPLVESSPQLLARDGVPRVAIVGAALPPEYQTPACFPAMDQFRTKAMELAAGGATGPKRIAVLSANAAQVWLDLMSRSAGTLGLRFDPRHLQSPTMSDPLAIRLCARGLVGDTPDRRPNVLIIDDDNFVEEATKGVVEAGVRVPDELRVIAHCNFPTPPHTAVPVTWLGFDIQRLLSICVDTLDRQRRGEPVEPMVWLPVQTAEQLSRSLDPAARFTAAIASPT